MNYDFNIKTLPGNPSYQREIPESKKRRGSLYGKKCLKINEHTEVWVSQSKTEAECQAIREKYANHLNL